MPESDPFAEKRRRLIDEIRQDARDTAFWTGRKALSERTLDAVAAVPRHAFMPEKDAVVAYINRPQPIGQGQTISQPFIVALMTDLLDLTGTEKVLEIGTGCGYQAAVLSRVAARVHTSDASPSGAGGTVAPLEGEAAREMWRHRERRGFAAVLEQYEVLHHKARGRVAVPTDDFAPNREWVSELVS